MTLIYSQNRVTGIQYMSQQQEEKEGQTATGETSAFQYTSLTPILLFQQVETAVLSSSITTCTSS